DSEAAHQRRLGRLAHFQQESARPVEHPCPALLQRAHQRETERHRARVAAHVSAGARLVEIERRLRQTVRVERCFLQVELPEPHAAVLEGGKQRLLPLRVLVEHDEIVVHVRGYSFAPLIQSRIVVYSGESLAKRTPPPCANVLEPAMPSVSELDVGLRRIRLSSGLSVSTTFR